MSIRNLKSGLHIDSFSYSSFLCFAGSATGLADEGAELNAIGGETFTALGATANGRHMRVVEMLLDKGADVNRQAQPGDSVLSTVIRGKMSGRRTGFSSRSKRNGAHWSRLFFQHRIEHFPPTPRRPPILSTQ